MSCKHPLQVFLILLCLAVGSYTQNWSGVLAPSRAVDWSSAGIPGGIPSANWTQCGSTIAAYAGTAATINSAIAACGTNQYVLLGAGTFTLSTMIDFASHSNVALRGAGADRTFVKFTGSTSCNGPSADVCIEGSFNWNGNPQHLTTWTAGFAPGTTQITLGSTAGLSVGQLLILDQANDATDTGNFFVNDTTSFSTEGGSPGRNVAGTDYNQQEYKLVTNISGNVVTISPALYLPNWSSSKGTSAWWATILIQNAGVESLTLDYTASTNTSGIMFWNAYKCWAESIRSIYTQNGSGGGRNHVWFQYSARSVVRDSFFYGTMNAANLSYGIETWQSGDILVENNIFRHIVSPLLIGNTDGSVFAYNYSSDHYFNNATWNMPGPSFTHDAGTAMNLFEGNQGTGMVEDNIHGTHNMHTYFRNLWIGRDPGKTQQTMPVILDSYSRYMNLIGNVMGEAGYANKYQTLAPDSTNCDTSIYSIGWQAGECSTALDAAKVSTTLMRWGNYDVVNSAVQWNSSEVPSGISPFGNPVPPNHNLPVSFYNTAQAPSWWPTPWGTVPYPPVGPDVTGGNVPNMGGHANNIPAQLCYSNTAFDPAYQTTYGVSGGSWSSGTATLTIGANSLAVGYIVTVAGVSPSGYNGTYVVTAVTGNTFSYSLTTDPGNYASGGSFKYPNILLFNANSCYYYQGTRPAPPTQLTATPH